MSVMVTCKCGRDMVLKDEFIGKKVRCSKCKEVVVVQAPPPDALGPALVDDDPLLPSAAVKAAVRPLARRQDDAGASSRPRSRARSVESTGAGSKTGLLVLLGVGLVFFLMVGGGAVAAYLLFFGGKGEQIVDAAPPPPPEVKKVDENKLDPNAKVTRLEPLYRLAHQLKLNDAAVTSDGKWFASAGDDAGLLWDARGKEVARLQPDTADARVASVAFTPDGKTLAVAFDGGRVRFWDVDAGRFLPKEKDLLEPDDRVVKRLRYSPDGNLLAARFGLGFLKLYDARDRAVYAKVVEKNQDFRDFAFSGDGKGLVAYTNNALIHWDVAKKQRKKWLMGPIGGLTEPYFTAVACAPTAPLVALCHDTDKAGESVGILFDLGTGVDKNAVHLAKGQSRNLTSMAFSADGKWLATGHGTGDDAGNFPVELWNAADGEWVATLLGAKDMVTAIAVTADFTRLIASSRDNHAYVWDLTRVQLPAN